MRVGRRWFFSNQDGWNPQLYEWGFTKNPVDVEIRAREERAVYAALAAALAPGHSALEVGPGTGNYTVALARRCVDVMAVDSSDAMLEYLGRRLATEQLENVELRKLTVPSRLSQMPRFDLALSVGVFNYVGDLDACVASLAGALKQGGQAVFTVPLRNVEGRIYAFTEFVTRRRVWLRSREEVVRAAQHAGLSVASLRAAGLSRRGLTLVVRAVADQASPLPGPSPQAAVATSAT